MHKSRARGSFAKKNFRVSRSDEQMTSRSSPEELTGQLVKSQ